MDAKRDATHGQDDLEREEIRALEEFGRELEEVRRRMREPTPRNRALAKTLGPKTRVEIAEARKVIREWIGEHPEDRFEFGKYASDLWRKEFELDEQERRTEGGNAPTESSTKPGAPSPRSS